MNGLADTSIGLHWSRVLLGNTERRGGSRRDFFNTYACEVHDRSCVVGFNINAFSFVVFLRMLFDKQPVGRLSGYTRYQHEGCARPGVIDHLALE